MRLQLPSEINDNAAHLNRSAAARDEIEGQQQERHKTEQDDADEHQVVRARFGPVGEQAAEPEHNQKSGGDERHGEDRRARTERPQPGIRRSAGALRSRRGALRHMPIRPHGSGHDHRKAYEN